MLKKKERTFNFNCCEIPLLASNAPFLSGPKNAACFTVIG